MNTKKDTKKSYRQNMKSNIKQTTKGKFQKNIPKNNIYNREVISFKVCLGFKEMNEFVIFNLKEYAKNNIMGRCHKEGYISNNHVEVIRYSSAVMKGSNIYFNVDYEFDVCYPYEGMEMICKIDNITKIGIKAVIEDTTENPVIVFASRIHNEKIFESEIIEEEDEGSTKNYKEGDMIKIKVVGHRFEINDPHLSVLGQIIHKVKSFMGLDGIDE